MQTPEKKIIEEVRKIPCVLDITGLPFVWIIGSKELTPQLSNYPNEL